MNFLSNFGEKSGCMKRVNIIMPLISAIVLTFASCRGNYITDTGEAWATSYHIVYSSDMSLKDSIEACIELVDSELSMFNPESELSRLNRGETDFADSHFCTVFDCAKYISGLTEGRYDPTVAPLVDLWGFGRNSPAGEPSEAEIAEALSSVGIADCSIDRYGRLRRKTPATAFDFSSLAKGYGVDCVADMLENNGVADYMVEIGGELRVSGRNPRGGKWRIQIDEPSAGMAHSRLTVLELGPDPVAVATSGNYRNYRADSLGRIYGHTLSALEGRPAETEVLSATVVAPTCMVADALATACMTGSAAQAAAIVTEAGASALIVTGEADGSYGIKKIGCLPTTENP